MKRVFLILLAVLPLCAMAQQIGYYSKQAVIEQMPEYTQAKESLAQLKAKYDAEATRGEEEFQRKFSDFLQGQKDFPQNILVKRQAELQTLMEAGMKFRQEAADLLTKAEQEMQATILQKLNAAVKTVGRNGHYACVLNIDSDLCPYIDEQLGVDLTQQIVQQLGLPQADAPAEH